MFHRRCETFWRSRRVYSKHKEAVEDFRSILAQYQDKVYRLACAMLGDQAQAEDAAQETFVRVWKGLGKFRGESSVSTWIFTIARRTCLDALKARKQTVGLEALVEKPRHEPDGLDVTALLAELPDRAREAVVLFYLQDKSYEDVARTMEIPMGTVKTLLFRARKQMIASVANSRLLKRETVR
jgi:RNA polymerase sigma-70 factor (ECF subfamily)